MPRTAKIQHPINHLGLILGLPRKALAKDLGVPVSTLDQAIFRSEKSKTSMAVDLAFKIFVRYGLDPDSLRRGELKAVFPEGPSLELAIKAWQQGVIYFRETHFANARGLVRLLSARRNRASKWIWGRLKTASTKAELLTAREEFPARKVLVPFFNELVDGPPLYEASVFKDLEISEETRGLISEAAKRGENSRLLNRLVLQAAYSKYLIKRAPSRLVIFEQWLARAFSYKLSTVETAARKQGKWWEFIEKVDKAMEGAIKDLSLRSSLADAPQDPDSQKPWVEGKLFRIQSVPGGSSLFLGSWIIDFVRASTVEAKKPK